MRASKLKRKRERQRRRFAQRPQQVEKPIARVKTAGLFGAILARPTSRAFDEVLQETTKTS
jgi:hypothetical protein